MSSLDKDILNCIRKIKMRIHRNIIVSYVLWGIIASLCLGSVICLAALLIPIYKPYMWAVKLTGAGMVLSLLIGLIRVPDSKRAAKVADSLGLKERVTTAMELMESESGFALLQKKDTLNKLQRLNYKDRLTFTIDKRQIILFSVFILIIFGSIFIPTPSKLKAEEKHQFVELKEEKLAKIEKVEKEIKENTKLNEKDRENLLKDLESLKQDIAAAQDSTELDKALDKFQKRTDSVKENYKEEDLKNLSGSLLKNESTAALAEALEKGNKEEVSKEISKLPETLQSSSPEEKKKVAESFAEMAKNTQDEELKKSLAEMAEKLASDNPEKFKDLMESLQGFDNALQKSMENRETQNELKDIQSDFKPSKESAAGEQNNQQNNGQGSNPEGNSPSGQNGTKPGEGSNQGNNPGQNPGNEGSQGSGNEEGSKPGDGNSTGNNSSGLNKPGSGSSPQGESVYVPPSNGTENTNVTGETGSEGDSEVVREGTAGLEPGKAQSLEKVIGKYKERAYENMNSYVIPEAMRDIIKNYFTSLEE